MVESNDLSSFDRYVTLNSDTGALPLLQTERKRENMSLNSLFATRSRTYMQHRFHGDAYCSRHLTGWSMFLLGCLVILLSACSAGATPPSSHATKTSTSTSKPTDIHANRVNSSWNCAVSGQLVTWPEWMDMFPADGQSCKEISRDHVVNRRLSQLLIRLL